MKIKHLYIIASVLFLLLLFNNTHAASPGLIPDAGMCKGGYTVFDHVLYKDLFIYDFISILNTMHKINTGQITLFIYKW